MPLPRRYKSENTETHYNEINKLPARPTPRPLPPSSSSSVHILSRVPSIFPPETRTTRTSYIPQRSRSLILPPCSQSNFLIHEEAASPPPNYHSFIRRTASIIPRLLYISVSIRIPSFHWVFSIRQGRGKVVFGERQW